MSEVSIDPAALEREADAILSEHAPPEVAPGGPPGAQPDLVGNATPEQILQGYQLVCTALVDRGVDAIAPAWHVTTSEKQSFADACAQALVLWFPDQLIPPKYMALLVVAGVGFEIVGKRRDPLTGALKPRHHAKPQPPVVSPAPANPAAP